MNHDDKFLRAFKFSVLDRQEYFSVQGFAKTTWTLIRGDELSDNWSLALFDCAISPGGVALYWTQEIVGVRADGVIGPISVEAINAIGDGAIKTLFYKREIYYTTRGAWADPFREQWREHSIALRKELGIGVKLT